MSEALNALGETIVAALPGAVTGHSVAYGELTITAQGRRHRQGRDLPARRSALPVRQLHRRDGGRLAGAREALRRRLSLPLAVPEHAHPREDRDRRGDAGAVDHRRVSRRRLVRARDLRSLRRDVHRPSRHAPPAHRLRLRGPSAAQGLPAHRLCRGALRRRAEARASTSRCGSRRNSAISISSRRGKARTTCCPATRRPSRSHERVRQSAVRRMPVRRGALYRGAARPRFRHLSLQHVPQMDAPARSSRSIAAPPSRSRTRLNSASIAPRNGPSAASANSAVRRCSTGWSARISMPCRRKRSTTGATSRSTSQIFIDEKPAYYDFANKTKNMTGAEVFAAFGASQRSGQGLGDERSNPACAISPSTSARSIRRRTACCAWCWSSTARSSSASIRISACCIAAPRS